MGVDLKNELLSVGMNLRSLNVLRKKGTEARKASFFLDSATIVVRDFSGKDQVVTPAGIKQSRGKVVPRSSR